LVPTRRSPANFKVLVAERVRQDIFQGRLKPGQKIDQDRLAEDLGLSKLPVREALILLENEGLVDNFPRRGSFVAPLTPDDIRDHYQLIGLVSGLAARRAATVITDDTLDQLRYLLDQFDRTGDAVEQERLNDEFHRLINRAGGGRRLRSALRLFAKTMPGHFYDFAIGWSDSAREAHENILAALKNRDPDAAERAVRDHMIWGADIAIANLRRIGFWT
jgi:DNA-binding GntR family transcriptional regulator